MSSILLYPTLSSIANYREISEGLVTAGQPTGEQFALVRDAGFETVVNLAMPDSIGAIPDEDLLIEELGMQYVPVPVRWQNPTRADLDAFFAVMDARKDRERLFVHCIANKRVSVFLYLYRILREGWREADAEGDLLGIWTPSDWWQSFVSQQLTDGESRP